MHPFAINYLFFSGYLVVLLLFGNLNKSFGRKEYLFSIISFLTFMVLHVCVDTNSVEDLPRYKVFFYEMNNLSLAKGIQLLVHGDYSWAVLNKLCAYISNDFTLVLFIYNLLYLGVHYYIAWKYIPYPQVSFVLLLSLSFDQSLFVLRQYMAVSLFLLSIPFILEKKIIPYLVTYLVALFFHTSSIIWLPVYFIYNVKSVKWLCCSFAIFSGASVVLALNPHLLLPIIGEYESYLASGEAMNMTLKMIPITYLLCYIFFLREHVFDEGIKKLCFIVVLIYCIAFLVAPPIGLITRLFKYFEVFIYLMVPITMAYMNNHLIRVVYLAGVLLLQGYLSIRGLEEMWICDYKTQEVSFMIFLLIGMSVFILWKYIKKLQWNNNF